MKHLLFSFLFLSFFVFQSCGDDDDSSQQPIENGFTFNGEFFSTDILVQEEIENGNSIFTLLGDATFSPSEGIGGDEIEAVLLNFTYDDSSSAPPSDNYIHNSDSGVETSFFATTLINVDVANLLEGTTLTSSGGTVELTFNSSTETYTIDYSIQTNGGTVEGFYLGPIDFIE